MDPYNADPRGLRKRRHGWSRVAQEYAVPIAGGLLFLCICVIVALHGRAGYWQRQAAEHETHHHSYKASHSSLQQALMMKERDLAETLKHRQTHDDKATVMQHRLEEEARALAQARRDMHSAHAEAADAKQRLATAQHDLDTCLSRVNLHGDSTQALEQQAAELRQRVAAHETRELQLLKHKQELETAVETWKAQAEAKGVHLENPAGMAGLMMHGISGSGGGLSGLPVPAAPVPSAPAVDGVQRATAMLGVQPTAAVPKAPVVVEHLSLVPAPAEQRPGHAMSNLR